MLQRYLNLFFACVVVSAPVSLRAEIIVVAVASNFAPAAEMLADDFERRTGHELRLVTGSSGRLYAQIVNAAPYDVFLSADSDRPARLEEQQLASAGSRFTYAIGQLVIWSRDPALAGQHCLEALRRGVTGKIAIANPSLAPYGVAAREFLQHEGLWQRVQGQLVVGENIAQTLQFAVNGGASIALVAAAQLHGMPLPTASCAEAVPAAMHAPVEQQAVLLARAKHKNAAQLFLDYLQSPAARASIANSGYRVTELPN